MIENKAISADKTSPSILKGSKMAISTSLLIIFRKGFSEGIAPVMWKLANVIPIHECTFNTPYFSIITPYYLLFTSYIFLDKVQLKDNRVQNKDNSVQ